jgi:hypothetical protein
VVRKATSATVRLQRSSRWLHNRAAAASQRDNSQPSGLPAVSSSSVPRRPESALAHPGAVGELLASLVSRRRREERNAKRLLPSAKSAAGAPSNTKTWRRMDDQAGRSNPRTSRREPSYQQPNKRPLLDGRASSRPAHST